jgi:hypothetical protein
MFRVEMYSVGEFLLIYKFTRIFLKMQLDPQDGGNVYRRNVYNTIHAHVAERPKN